MRFSWKGRRARTCRALKKNTVLLSSNPRSPRREEEIASEVRPPSSSKATSSHPREAPRGSNLKQGRPTNEIGDGGDEITLPVIEEARLRGDGHPARASGPHVRA